MQDAILQREYAKVLPVLRELEINEEIMYLRSEAALEHARLKRALHMVVGLQLRVDRLQRCVIATGLVCLALGGVAGVLIGRWA